MTARGWDSKKIAEDWLKQAINPGKDYFWRVMKSHKEQMNNSSTYSGIHALTYKMMVKHPWGQEYLKIERHK